MDFLDLQDSELLLSPTDKQQDDLSNINQSNDNSNLIFVDRRVNNYQSLIEATQIDNAEVFLLDSTKDGIVQISQIIDRYQNIQSIHIVSHGDVGSIRLGSTELNIDTLDRYQDRLSGWSESLSENADLLFYSCNLAKGDRGSALVEEIGNVTGADIAASNDLTGNKQLGGDWDFEVTTDSIETDLAFDSSIVDSYDEILYTFTRNTYTAADVIDFTLLGYTYDTGYNNNFDILPPQAANQTGLTERKNAANMTQQEIDDFINAILTLKNTFETTDNGQQISIYDQFVATHFATRDAQGRIGPNGLPLVNPAHGGSAFGPWHRALLYEFEEALQTVNPNVTVPYWDWTDSTSTFNTIFQDNFMGPDGTGGPNGDRVTTGYFTLANGWGMRRDLSTGRWQGLNTNTIDLTRNFGNNGGSLGTVAQVNNAFATNNYNTFRSRLEGGPGMHNSTHNYIGGIIRNVAGSPNDPIFWLLHSNVDRIWAEWQLNNHWGNSFYPASGQAYGRNLNDPLYPWDNNAFTVAADLQDLLPNLPSSLRAFSSNAITGTETIEGNLENNDVVNPGNSPGRLRVNGDYTQTEDGELTIDIIGRKAGRKHDVLDISGDAILDGTLNIYFLDGFVPKVGDTFRFLHASDVTGEFDKINIFGLKDSYNFDFDFKDGAYYLKVDSRYRGDNPSQGFARTREQLHNDDSRNLYNPGFGLSINHFVFGNLFGEANLHHGVGRETVEHLETMEEHSQDSDWFLPLNLDEIRLLQRIDNGKRVPERLLYPRDLHHDDDEHEHEHEHSDLGEMASLLGESDNLHSVDSLVGFESSLDSNYQLIL
jgi:tyrosinase